MEHIVFVKPDGEISGTEITSGKIETQFPITGGGKQRYLRVDKDIEKEKATGGSQAGPGATQSDSMLPGAGQKGASEADKPSAGPSQPESGEAGALASSSASHPLDSIKEPPGMTAGEAEERRQWIERIKKYPDAVAQEYLDRFPKIINGDRARELFAPFAEGSKADRTRLTRAGDGIAQHIAELAYNRAISKAESGSHVLFTAGGPGSGKSEAISRSGADIVFDSSLSNYDRAKRLISKAL
jgi:hypothetical protein